MHKHYTSSSCLKVVYSGNTMQMDKLLYGDKYWQMYYTIHWKKIYWAESDFNHLKNRGESLCSGKNYLFGVKLFLQWIDFFADTCKIHLMHMHPSP